MTNLNVLFINPPQTRYPGSSSGHMNKLPPLGLITLAGFIKSKGHRVFCIDALKPDDERSLQDGGIRTGMTEIQLKTELKKHKPDIIGISNLFTAQYPNAVFCAKICKEIFPKIPVCIGGGHPSVADKQISESEDCFDIVVRAEGELTFAELLDNWNGDSFTNLGQIDGITYRDTTTGEIRQNKPRAWIKNLDALPFPAYELANLKYYLEAPYPNRSCGTYNSLSFITSRGCPYGCNFCSIHLHMGHSLRFYSVEYVIEHLRWILKNLTVKHINFEDDNFTGDINRAKAILKTVLEKKLKFTWYTPNGIRADSIDEELLELAKKTGVQGLKIGVESGNQYVLSKIIKKNLKLEDVIKASALCKKHKIPLSAFFIIGFPGETLENMKETVEFKTMLFDKYHVGSSISIATPLLGTSLWKETTEKRLLTLPNPTYKNFAEATQGQGRSIITTDDWTPQDIAKMQEYAATLERQVRIKHLFTQPVWSLKHFAKSKNKSKSIVNKIKDVYDFARCRSKLGYSKFKLSNRTQNS